MISRAQRFASLFLLSTFLNLSAIPRGETINSLFGSEGDRPLSAGQISAPSPVYRVLPEGQLPHDRRLGPLRTLDSYFPFTPPASVEAWKVRAERLRRQVLLAAGLWPMPDRTPAHAVIHGKVDREGYTVEKVYFESYPGHFVTGSLYRPKGRAGKRPAMLCPYGHWAGGRYFDAGLEEVRREIKRGAEKFEVGGRYILQAQCVQLARMGCVVLQYDMVGVADSRQLEHSPGSRPEMNTPKNWGFFSPQAELRLQTQFGLQTYNSLRALDFLCALPDVDPERIGMTGGSGGGTQTFILCAIDPRPAAELPAVMVSTAMQGGCTCENASYLRIGAGNVDFAALMAPKPLGLLAAHDWTLEIEKKGLPELKQLYKMLGAEDCVQAWTFPQFGHNYNYVSRAVMYGWFNRHLKLGQKEPIIEEDHKPLTHDELCVWDQEHPRPPAGPDYERSLLRWLTENSRKQMENLRPKDEKSLAEYRRVVVGAIEVMIGQGLPEADSLAVKPVQSQDLGPWRLEKLLLGNRESGAELPVIRLGPQSGASTHVVVWIDPRGKQGLFDAQGRLRPIPERLLQNGCSLWAADLFGQGEFTSDGKPIQKTRLNRGDNNAWLRYPGGYTFGYNPSVFVERVHDVLTLVAAARKSNAESAAPQVDLIGLRGAGHWVAAARAVAGGAIRRAVVDTSGFRFTQVNSFDHPDFFPGGAKYDDLPGLLALAAPHPLWLAGEKEPPPPLLAAYRAAGKENSLVVYQGDESQKESAALDWLLK
jgi:hypothetical protein